MLNMVNHKFLFAVVGRHKTTYVSDSVGEATSWPGVASGLL
jgi:hypothetical protein